MTEENTKIIVTDTDGNEHEYDLLFTAENDGKKYVVYCIEDGETVLPYRYSEDGKLEQLKDDKEWDFIEKELEKYEESLPEEEDEEEE